MRRLSVFAALVTITAALLAQPAAEAPVTAQGTFAKYSVTVKKSANDFGFTLSAYLTGLSGSHYTVVNAHDLNLDGTWDRIVACPDQLRPDGRCRQYEAPLPGKLNRRRTCTFTDGELRVVASLLNRAVEKVAPDLAPAALKPADEY